MKTGDLVQFKSAVEPTVGIVWKITTDKLTERSRVWVHYRPEDPPAWAPPKFLKVINL